jgi:hypothetical protein
MYQVQVPLSGIAGWRFLERTEDMQKTALNDSASVRREIDYFKEKVGAVESAEDLVSDRRLLRFVLTSYGLEGEIDKKALVRKVLEDGTDAKDALANRISNTGFKAMAKDFGFGNATGAQTGTAGFAEKIVANYQERVFENEISNVNPNLGLVMTLSRQVETLSEGEGKSWYTVLGDKQLRSVFEGALGLPASFSAIDVDQQARLIEKKARQFFGGEGSLKALQDPKNVEKLVLRFLARKQIEEGPTMATPQSGALFLLQNSNSNASAGLMNLLY